ncbi:hypothetical protein F5Y07DRAFT_406661 [Xylaria sp. FL0933]|nr:hypothetical protein F5Y07DRAFT_406661 [Xylaria sp. FL0933]
MIVVKVVRTVYINGDADGSLAIINTAKDWLREVRNHARVKQHSYIAKFIGADAWFLCIYIEYVDA